MNCVEQNRINSKRSRAEDVCSSVERIQMLCMRPVFGSRFTACSFISAFLWFLNEQ